MRRIIGWAVLGCGGLLTVAGGLTAAYLGPDDSIDLGDRRVSTETAAMVAGKGAFTRVGPALVLTVDARGGPELFAGVAQEIDAKSLLGGAKHEVADSVEIPLAFSTRTAGEGAEPLPDPRTLDIWAASTSGSGRQSLSWQTMDGNWNLVLMRADGKPGIEAEVNAGLEFENAFVYALAAMSWGLCLGAGGVYLLRRRDRGARGDPADYWPSDAATEILTRGGRP